MTSPARPSPRYPDLPPGLESLIEATPQDGTTTYNRAQLLAADTGLTSNLVYPALAATAARPWAPTPSGLRR